MLLGNLGDWFTDIELINLMEKIHMKIVTFVMFLLVVPLFNCLAQLPFYGDMQRPKGKVKSFTERCYETTGGINTLVQKRSYAYDLNGELIEQKIYNTIDSNAIEQTISYVYENKELSEEQGDGEHGYRIKYMYYDNGNMMAKKYISDSVKSLERYEYDNKNNRSLRVCYDGYGELKLKEVYKYDNLNNLILKEWNDYDTISNSGSIAYSIEPTLLLGGERAYAPNGRLKYSITYEYDINNNIAQETRYTGGGFFDRKRKYAYDYDEKGNWLILNNKNKASTYLTKRDINYY